MLIHLCHSDNMGAFEKIWCTDNMLLHLWSPNKLHSISMIKYMEIKICKLKIKTRKKSSVSTIYKVVFLLLNNIRKNVVV